MVARSSRRRGPSGEGRYTAHLGPGVGQGAGRQVVERLRRGARRRPSPARPGPGERDQMVAGDAGRRVVGSPVGPDLGSGGHRGPPRPARSKPGRPPPPRTTARCRGARAPVARSGMEISGWMAAFPRMRTEHARGRASRRGGRRLSAPSGAIAGGPPGRSPPSGVAMTHRSTPAACAGRVVSAALPGRRCLPTHVSKGVGQRLTRPARGRRCELCAQLTDLSTFQPPRGGAVRT